MRSVFCLVFQLFIGLSSSAYYCHHHYKSECFTTNKTLVLDKCRTIPLSRYRGQFLIAGYFARKMKRPSISYEVFYRQQVARNFHSAVHVKDIDFCALMKNPLLLPFTYAHGGDNDGREMFSQDTRNCIFTANEHGEFVYTHSNGKCDENGVRRKPELNMGDFFPDGDYKVVLTVTDNGDSFAFHYYFRIKNGDKRSF